LLSQQNILSVMICWDGRYLLFRVAGTCCCPGR